MLIKASIKGALNVVWWNKFLELGWGWVLFGCAFSAGQIVMAKGIKDLAHI